MFAKAILATVLALGALGTVSNANVSPTDAGGCVCCVSCQCNCACGCCDEVKGTKEDGCCQGCGTCCGTQCKGCCG